MRKLVILILIFALFGCSLPQTVDPTTITLPDKPYLTNLEWEKPEQIIQVENAKHYTITQHETKSGARLCVMATREDDSMVEVCQNYQLFTLRNSYDYQNMKLSDILVQYLSSKGYLNQDIVYFYYNTVTEEEVVFNMDELILGASTTKVPMIMAYTDLIKQRKVKKSDELYFNDYLFEESEDNLTNYYTVNDFVPIEFLMKQSILKSDNSSINVLMAHFENYSEIPFRELFSEYYPIVYSEDFYVNNYVSGNLMLNVLKKLYQNEKDYRSIIEDMKLAFPDRYMKINQYPFEIAHKFGYFEGYSHDMGIVYTPSPILVGVFTTDISYEEVLGVSEYLIADLVNIMIEYTLVNEKN